MNKILGQQNGHFFQISASYRLQVRMKPVPGSCGGTNKQSCSTSLPPSLSSPRSAKPSSTCSVGSVPWESGTAPRAGPPRSHGGHQTPLYSNAASTQQNEAGQDAVHSRFSLDSYERDPTCSQVSGKMSPRLGLPDRVRR